MNFWFNLKHDQNYTFLNTVNFNQLWTVNVIKSSKCFSSSYKPEFGADGDDDAANIGSVATMALEEKLL